MKLRNVFRSKAAAAAAASEPSSPSRRSSRTAPLPRTVLDQSYDVRPPTLKRREKKPDPLDGRSSTHNRNKAKQDLLGRKKPLTKQAAKARPTMKKKHNVGAGAPGSSPVPKKPGVASRNRPVRKDMGELERMLNTPLDHADSSTVPSNTPKGKKKKTLDEVLSRGRSSVKANGGAHTVGGGRSVASRKSLKSRSSSKGPNRKNKPYSNPQGGSDENTSANSDTIHGGASVKQSVRSNRTTRTAPANISSSSDVSDKVSSRRQPRSMSPRRPSRGRSKSRPRKPLDEDRHVGLNDRDNVKTTGGNGNHHTPRTPKSKLSNRDRSFDDPALHISPAQQQQLRKQTERVERDGGQQRSPKSTSSSSQSPKPSDGRSIDDTTSTDGDDILCSPKAMPTVSQDLEEDTSDKESYFRQRIQHYQSEFFSMQVQLTEAQGQINKLMELRKKDKSRLEEAAEKFIELKTTSKQSKAEVKHCNDRIYELEDIIVRKEKETDQLREEIEQKLDRIDELERTIEERDDPILSNYPSARMTDEDKVRDLSAWEEELKAKEERLSAESTFDSLKLKQMEEREQDLAAREKQLQSNLMLLQQKQRGLDEQESRIERRMAMMKISLKDSDENDATTTGSGDKMQKMMQEIAEKDLQLEKASKAFVKMEKKHEESMQKLKDSIKKELEERDRQYQALERKLKHEQRTVEQLRAGGATMSGGNDGDGGSGGSSKDETIAELKLELAKMEDELNANDPVGYASKLKTEVMLLKEQNRALKEQMDSDKEETMQKLQKKDETIAFMQNELVKIKMNGGTSIAGIAGLKGGGLTDSGGTDGSLNSYGSPTTVVEQDNSNFDGNRSFTSMFQKIGQKRAERKR